MRNRLVEALKTPFNPEVFEVNGRKVPYMRQEIFIEIGDVFSFLAAQTLYPKVYWETPEEGIIAGFGSALYLDELPTFGSKNGPRFFGGSDFMERRSNTWKTFPKRAYFLPLIEVEQRGRQTRFFINRLKAELNVLLEKEVALEKVVKGQRFCDSPPYPVWEKEIQKTLQDIKQGNYVKIVRARQTTFTTETNLSPYAMLKGLKGRNRFSFQFSKEMTFMGVSPETLYRREGSAIESAAVAGTRPIHVDEKELLKSVKDKKEFLVVSNSVKKALSPLCKTLQIKDEHVLKGEAVQHLYHRFQGVLKEGVDDHKLLETLHPTPALGGFPRQKALEEIEKRESFDRGWYGAPVGWVSPSGGHHLVGIRSALVDKKNFHLFTGVGIIEGSDPKSEWEELEEKMKEYRNFI